MNPPTSRPQCGTYAGAMRHRRRRETPCTPCRNATRAYNAERMRTQGTGRPAGPRGADHIKYGNDWVSLMEHIAEGNTLLVDGRLEGQLCNPGNAHLFDLTAPDDLTGRAARRYIEQKTAAAERLCNRCPVRDACADWAATQHRSKHTPAGAYLPTPRPRRTAA